MGGVRVFSEDPAVPEVFSPGAAHRVWVKAGKPAAMPLRYAKRPARLTAHGRFRWVVADDSTRTLLAVLPDEGQEVPVGPVLQPKGGRRRTRLPKVSAREAKRLLLEPILAAVMAEWGLEASAFLATGRGTPAPVTEARKVFCAVARAVAPATCGNAAIGAMVGLADHTTVRHHLHDFGAYVALHGDPLRGKVRAVCATLALDAAVTEAVLDGTAFGMAPPTAYKYAHSLQRVARRKR